MKKIIFLNRFFYPDHSATSQILSDLAFHLAGLGAEVHVVTSRLRYDDPAAVLLGRETVGGVPVHRVATTRFGRARLLGRAVDEVSFYLSAAGALGCIAGYGTVVVVVVVVAKTDPPMVSLVAAPIARLRGAGLVNWLQDLFPEVGAVLTPGTLRRQRGLGNILFRPSQARKRLRESLGLADVHLISLRPALEGLIMPSKFYGIAAAGRPVLYVGDPEGEIPQLLCSAECGETVRVGEGDRLAAAVRRLRDDPARGLEWGANARRLFEAHFDKRLTLAAWEQVLESVMSRESQQLSTPSGRSRREDARRDGFGRPGTGRRG